MWCRCSIAITTIIVAIIMCAAITTTIIIATSGRALWSCRGYITTGTIITIAPTSASEI